MNHKLNRFFKILAVGAVALAAVSVRAQAPMAAPGTGANYGLLGQNYYGFVYSYTHHVSSSPDPLNTYAFKNNSATAPGLDIGIYADWQTGNANGVNYRSNTLNVPFTLYKYTSWGRPLIEFDLGWMWQRNTGSKINGFRYGGAIGFELQAAPNLVITPTFGYTEASRQKLHGWDAGGQAALRFTQDWSGTFGVRMDEHDNITFSLGLNMHY